jgi:hypothetical protein
MKSTSYITLTVAVGAVFIGYSLVQASSFRDLVAYVCYFVLALLTSSLKVHLPGIRGTISLNFLFVLVSIAVFSFTETVILASAASVVQCIWKAKRRPNIIQVSFNVATLAISSGIAYRAAHALAGTQQSNLIVLLALSVCLYFMSNTLLVSGVLSLIDNKPLLGVWKQCYMWSFPYYLAGAVIAALIVVSGQTMGWAMPLLILPLMFMIYAFYRTWVQKLSQGGAT